MAFTSSKHILKALDLNFSILSQPKLLAYYQLRVPELIAPYIYYLTCIMSVENNHAIKGTWRTYTPSNGLAALKCEHLLEDRQGYLWIATCTGGISRFDGEEFTTFTIHDGLCGIQVYSVIEDRQGRIWCGTFDGGLCWFDGHRFHWVDTHDPHSNNAITFMAEDRQGRLWCAGPTLIGYLEGDRFHNLFADVQRDCDLSDQFPSTEYFGIAEDGAGDLWFGGNSRLGLLRYDGARFHHVIPETHGAPTRFFPVYADTDGTVWVGGSRLWRIADGALQPQSLELTGTHNIRKIQGDHRGRIWLCTLGNGVYCLDGVSQVGLAPGDAIPAATEAQHFTRADGLAFDVVNGMLEDREGLLWFATWGGGLSCYDPHSIRRYPQPQKPSSRRSPQVPTGYQVSNDLQTSAFALYQGRLVDMANTPSNADHWYAIHQDSQHQLWLGTEAGLCRYRDGSFVAADTRLARGPVHTISSHRSGGLLLGILNAEQQLQLAHWDNKQTTILHTLEQSAPQQQHISAICQTADGDIWFGINVLADHGPCHGLFRRNDAGLQHYTIADGLPDNRIADVLVDSDGVLWIATLGGLCRYDGRDFTPFTTEDGLPNNHIRCLHCDGAGHLWLGTESGVIRHQDGAFQPVLPQHIGATRKIASDADSSLWFGTAQGRVNYRPKTVPPRMRIDKIVADQTYAGTTAERILTAAQQVTVEYRGMSMRSLPQHLLYIWRLVGRDEAWQPPTRQRQTIFRNLPPGDYTFQVRAIDGDFNYSEPAQIQFTVQPDPLVQGLHQALNQTDPNHQFTGESETLQWVNSQLATVAKTEISVLILGETGTGKGLAARVLHALSQRPGAFIQVNCGAIPQGLVESELFGHEKGAFTGADARQLGKFELAKGGTLFLDEIGDMPLEMQRVLLQVLQERTFHRVGGRTPLHSEARIIAATNRDLAKEVGEGLFREDLYYRLGAFEIRVPPLRQRREDIPQLVAHFATVFAHHLHRPVPTVDPAALEKLCAYDWPGNVRELEHMVQRAVLLCQQDTIRAKDLADLAPSRPTVPETDASTPVNALTWLAQQPTQGEDLLDSAEELLIKAALAQTGGNKSEAAKLLGTGRKRIERRAKKYDIS